MEREGSQMSKPSLITRFKLATQIFQKGFPGGPIRLPSSKKAAPYVWPVMRNGELEWTMMDFESYAEEGFQTNTLIYMAIMYKVRAYAQTHVCAYQGDPDNPTKAPPTHDLSRLLARPNQEMSWVQFQSTNLVYLNLSGNFFVWLDRPSPEALPTAMYPLRPDRVKILVRDQKIVGYLYIPEGKRPADGVPLLPQDVMHVKLPNPLDPLEGFGYGLSPMSPLAKSGDVDNAVTDFLKIFFQQGAQVNGILKFDVPLDPEQVDEIQERWKQKYGGVGNWAEVGVLDQGGNYERTGMTFNEMGFESLDARNETRVVGPFGVPLILLGTRLALERSTYANYEEARKAFWEDTFQYEVNLIEDEFSYYLQTDDAYIKHDYTGVHAFKQDTPNLVKAAKDLWSMGVPLNQAVKAVGLRMEDVEGGDEAYLPNNIKTIDQVHNPPDPMSNRGASIAKPEDGTVGGMDPNAIDDERGGAKQLIPFPFGPRQTG